MIYWKHEENILLILCLSTMYPVVNAGRVVQSFNDGWYYAACDDNRLQEVQTPWRRLAE